MIAKTSRMRVIRLVGPGKPLEMAELALPSPASNEVLIRVRAAGICHSDVHYRRGTSPVEPLPLTLGHEVAGTIEARGSEVSSLQPGERVCVHYLATCGMCEFCYQGNEQ